MQRIYDSYKTAVRDNRTGGRHQPAKPAFPTQLKLQPSKRNDIYQLVSKVKGWPNLSSQFFFFKNCPVGFITTSNTQLQSQNWILMKLTTFRVYESTDTKSIKFITSSIYESKYKTLRFNRSATSFDLQPFHSRYLTSLTCHLKPPGQLHFSETWRQSNLCWRQRF